MERGSNMGAGVLKRLRVRRKSYIANVGSRCRWCGCSINKGKVGKEFGLCTMCYELMKYGDGLPVVRKRHISNNVCAMRVLFDYEGCFDG